MTGAEAVFWACVFHFVSAVAVVAWMELDYWFYWRNGG